MSKLVERSGLMEQVSGTERIDEQVSGTERIDGAS
jgi:hypothetical protein